MKRSGRFCALLLAPFALAAIAGCGGGGGGTGSTTTATRAAVDVYVTDGFSDAYKQVLATIYKIELSTDGTTYQTVYADTSGRTLDLASLAGTAELLNSVTIPAATYTQARITFGDHVTLVTKAGVSTSVAVDTSIGADANGQIAVTIATPTRVLEHQTNAVYVDFKLAEFQIVGSVLKPAIVCGGASGHEGDRHTAHLRGTVANLSGVTSFTLVGEGDRSTTVDLTDTTTVTSGLTGATVTLANGQSVTVEGTYDPATSTLTATSVTVNDSTSIHHAEAEGTVASIDMAAGSFVLTVERANDIEPTEGTVTVQTDAHTRFPKGRHQQSSLADITVGSTVEVGGTFDTTTQTITARLVGLH